MSVEVVHRLGVLVCGVLLVGTPARWLGTVRRARRVRGRLAALLLPEPRPSPQRHQVRDYGRRWLPLVGIGCAGWVLIGGVVGVLVGPAAGFGVRWWLRRRNPAPAEEYDVASAARQLPLAADLVGACIAAGASPVAAAHAVGVALGGPVGERLAQGAAEVRLGGEPVHAWRRLET
ncbi:hypothetical protein AB8A21_08780 [Streptomyces sp. BF23-18]|uniref:hypothetical protein n=1 Tax=Streptomyces sp. BF23-18 TaxID=3240282 RepID=UPI0034E43CF8